MLFTINSGGEAIQIEGHEPAGQGPHKAVVLLHGAGGHVNFWFDRVAPMATQLGIALYAVHYFDRTKTSSATPAMLADGVHVPLWMEAVRDALNAIAKRTNVDPQRIALLGISLGAFLSLALATQGATVKAIVEISGGLVPPYEGQATGKFPPVLIVHGDRDTVVPVMAAHRLTATLKRLGVPHQSLILPGEGHWFSAPASVKILATVAQYLRDKL